MKYTSLKKQDVEVQHIKVPTKGIDNSTKREKIGEDFLSFSKNIMFENGVLKTRKGLNSKLDCLFDTSFADVAESRKIQVTDTYVNLNEERLRLVRADVKYDISLFFVFVFGVNKNGNIKSLGKILFRRRDDDTFFIPFNITFYSGKPQSGGGIFALVSLENMENTSQKSYCVYEIDSDFNEWNLSSGFYIPTVYINGRGNAYDTVDWKFDSKPLNLEKQNLLNDSFYAYYSSDGASSSFRLPFNDIDNKTVICRIFHKPDDYCEWTIEAGQVNDTKSFAGHDVKLQLDRAKGIINFIVGDSDFAIPVMNTYRENNIRILAHKTIDNGFQSVASAECVATNGSVNYFSGGIDKSKLYYCDYENPLYFPFINENNIGGFEEKINLLKQYDNKLIAFKQNGVFAIEVKKGQVLNDVSILPDNGNIFKKPESFTVSVLSSIGINGKTAVECSDKILWFTSNDDICSLSSSGKIEILSDKIKGVLKDIVSNGEALCGCMDKYYVLSFGSKAIIINTDGDSFYFELPDNIIYEGTVTVDGKLYFIYRSSPDDYSYLAGLDGDKDTVISGTGESAEIKVLPIESEISLKGYDFNSISKNKCVKYIDLDLAVNGEYKITVGDGNVSCEFKSEKAEPDSVNTIRAITDLTGVRSINIDISSNNSIAFGGGDIYYTMN